MRLSEILGKDVIDEQGARAGRVHDVRVRQDGPVTSGVDAALRVEGLVVGRGGVAERLGYHRTGARGPWIVQRLLARHQPKFVPWTRVRVIDDDRVVIAGSCQDLDDAPPLPDGGAVSR